METPETYFSHNAAINGMAPLDASGPDVEDLEEWERLFQAIIRRSLAGLVIFQENRIVFANPAFQSLVGLDTEAIARIDPFDLVHPAERDMVRSRAAQRLEGHTPPDDYEFRIIAMGGQTKWVRLLSTSIRYRGRTAILANILDVDRRKRAEEKQQEAYRLHSLLLDSLPHPAMLVRRDRLILDANRHARDLGARVGGFCGDEFGRLAFASERPESAPPARPHPTHPERSICNFCHADEALELQKPIAVRSLKAFGRYWDVCWVPVDADIYLHYAIDVTEQHVMEQAVRASEERYRLITDAMNDGLSVQDREGIITQVNRRLCEISGFARHELIGRPLGALVSPPDGRAPDGAPQGQPPEPTETFILHRDGRRIPVACKGGALVDEAGRQKGSYIFISDIRELRALRRQALISEEFEGLVGRELSMRRLFAEILELGACDFPVLIQGESGTGKELVAQAIHRQGHRQRGLFVPVNCAALPEGLLESELFGHVRGAFTGAIRDKKGRFELAHGGTIFLDEISELSPSMQVKLLRVIQEGAFERVGDHRTTRVNVRIISATNKDLAVEMAAGRFRPDLYYRLCVMPLRVPPLRERKNDIGLLAAHFLAQSGRSVAGRALGISPAALVRLMTYDWPGNVRELQNAVHYALIKSRGEVIQAAHLPPTLKAAAAPPALQHRRRHKLQPAAVREALRLAGGNKLQAAAVLGIHRATLYRFLATTGLDEPAPETGG